MAELPAAAAADPLALNPADGTSLSPSAPDEMPQIEKVDVDMLWNDFISSLEELRHSPFQHLKKRFWYRIDSLKVIFLGCDTVLTGASKIDKIGSVRVRMENLRPYVVTKPRIWTKVMELLCRLCEDEAMDPGDVERAFLLLSKVQAFRAGDQDDSTQIRYFAMNCQLITFRLVLPLAERLLKQKKGGMRVHLSTTLDEFMRVISPNQQAVSSIRQDISTGAEGPKETLRAVISFVNQFLERSQLGREIPLEFQSICLLLLLFDDQAWTHPLEELLTTSNIDLLLDTQSYNMRESPSDGYCQLSFLLELIWILQVVSQASGTDVSPATVIVHLCEQTKTWRENLSQPEKYQASIKLVEVCVQVILAEGLEEAENLIQTAVPVLVQYSLEGYLSSEPDGFLAKVLELLCVSVESLEMAPGETVPKPHVEFLRVIFPNVFSEVFGFDYDLFSDSLLEFATNALFSKKRKALLREGLHQIVDIARIFKPRDFLLAVHAQEEINQMVAELLNEILEAALNTEIPEPRSSRKKNLIAFFGESPSPQEVDPNRALNPAIPPASIREYVKMNAQATPTQRVEKKERAMILSLLLKTGSALVKKNEDLSYLIASVLPQLLSHLKYWEANIRLVVISLLKFGVVGMESGELKWFQIYGVILPKLIKRIGSLDGLPDPERATLLIDVSQFLIDRMEQQIDVSELATYGLDLLFNTRPGDSTTGIKEAISMLTKNFAAPTQSSLLLLLQTDFDFIRNNLPEEHAESSRLFYYFLLRGRRAEIRSFHHICKPSFAEPRFKKIRSLLYHLPDDSFQELPPTKGKAKAQDAALGSSRVFLLTELVLSLLGIRETPLSNILMGPVLDAIESMVARPFTDADTAQMKRQLRKIDVYSILHEEKTIEDPAGIFRDFQDFFPPEILNSETAFHKLGLMAERLQAAQPKYAEIKSMALSAISTFVAPLDAAPDLPLGPLERRVQAMNRMLLELPQNKQEIQRLAFSQGLWDTPLEIRVQTNGAHNDGESFKNALRGCFLGLVDIMKELQIKELSWRGKQVDPETFFNFTPTEVRPLQTPAPPLDPDDIANNPNHPHNNNSNNLMTIEELKGRRAFAVRAIEQKMKDSPRQNPVLVDCKMEILMEEERLEAEFQRQKAQPLQPKDFSARLNLFLFDTADCCDTHIIGCYAPGQVHCEKPIEIGLRASGGFLSIYSQQDGVELENSEVVFTDQGLYLYKAYSNGHVYDTSMIWLHIFKALLSPPYSLPAIIVPRGFPTFITYELLTKYISPELTGSQLSWKKDFYERTEIYLDFAIERVKGGFDLILTPENLVDISALIQGTEQEKDLTLPNQKVRSVTLHKDLAGIVYEQIISSIVSHQDLEIQELKVLGRPISAYVSQYIETGVATPKILTDGLDFPRFARGKKRYDPILKSPEKLTQTAQQVVEKLVTLIDEKIDDWCANLDLESFFELHRAPFFEFQKFLDQSTPLSPKRNRRAEVRAVMEASILLVSVSAFPVRYQLELMRWIFKNEDKVWRFRGGRDRHETVEDFLQFVEIAQGPIPAKCPGVVAFALLGPARGLPPNPDRLEAFSFQNIVGYAVGEYILLGKSDMETYQRAKPEQADTAGVCYEIVTAWVDTRFRGLAISPDMYSEVMLLAGRLRKCDSILFDLQKGGLEKVISRSWIFWALGRLRLLPWIIRTREDSYTIDNTLTKREEAFEQVIVNATVYSWATWAARIFHSVGSLLTGWAFSRKGK